MRVRTRTLLLNLAVSLLIMALVRAWLAHHEWDLRLWFTDFGEHRLGGNLPRISGLIAWSENGPFSQGRPVDRFCNFLCRWGPWLTINAASFLTSASAYLLLAGPLAKVRPLRSRGPTRCGRCGYALTGLREPRCPECGGLI